MLSLRLVCDENISRAVVETLRDRGHDVTYVRESLQGASDVTITGIAQAERRGIVTQDKDFGELVFRSRLSSDCGVVLFRLGDGGPNRDCARIVEVIESQDDWSGQFVVADDDKLRIRPLPRPLP